jgi:hypothetical protein
VSDDKKLYPQLSPRGIALPWEAVLSDCLTKPVSPSNRLMYMAVSRLEAERLWDLFSPEEKQRVILEWRGAYGYLSDHPDMKEGSSIRLSEIRFQVRGILDEALVSIDPDRESSLRESIAKRIDELIARAFR